MGSLHSLLFIISVLATLSFLITVLNFITMRKVVDRESRVTESVAVLVPMRNEEFNVEALLTSLLASRGLTEVEYSVLNDGSTDQTGELVSGYRDRVRTLQGAQLPQGWLGKPYACQQLSQESKSKYLVFIDADLRVRPNAIAASISFMEKTGWDFISPYPAEHGKTFLMRIFQPLLQWSWLASVPLRLAERTGRASMVIANGQFFIVRRDAYESIGGHESVKGEVLEDLCLARNLVAAGFKGGVAEASAIAECTMYEENADLISGYTKSLWTAFGGLGGTIATMAILVLTQVLPIILIIAGVQAAFIPFLLVGTTHLLAAIRVRTAPINLLLHPLATLILIALICESYRRKSRGQLEWRGRRVI